MQERRDLPWPKQLNVLDQACCDVLNRSKINAFTQKVSEILRTIAYQLLHRLRTVTIYKSDFTVGECEPLGPCGPLS